MLLQLIETKIQKAVAVQTPLVIALDGRAGSGKTTFATRLAEKYPIDVISMDDFFLPFDMKTPNRLAIAGNNVHHERFLEEIVPNIRRNSPWHYNAYSCQTKAFQHKLVHGFPVLLIEGVYSCHPILQSIYDFKIGFDIYEDLQKDRILKRNGPDMWAKFETMWIPLENDYFETYKIYDACDYVVNNVKEIMT